MYLLCCLSLTLHLIQSPELFADYAFLFIGVFGSISQGMQAYSNQVQLLNPQHTSPPPLSLSFSLLVDHLAQLIQLSGGSLVSSVEESTALGNLTTCIVCDEEKFVQLPRGCGLVQVKSGWILDCLSNYR